MDAENDHDIPISQLNSTDNDEANVIDPLLSQSTYFSHLNPQTPIPPLPNPFLNKSNQIPSLNQFQMAYGFHPYSFQGLMNAPTFPFETQTPTSSKKKGRKRKCISEPPQPIRRNWTKDEDVALTKAWLHTSIDPIIGTDQANNTLWRRIHLVWKEFLANEFIDDRPISGLAKRWCIIQGAVNKFHGIYEQLARSPRSGTNVEDLKRNAHKVYKETSGDNKPFIYEHCWAECTKNAKWYTQMSSSNSQKYNGGKQSSQNSSTPSTSSILNDSEPITVDTPRMDSIDVDGIVRPPGRKTSKDKTKIHCQDKSMMEVLSKLQASIQQQYDHNQEELELKRENTLAMKKELELKEKELALKAKSQRQRDQQKILNQDLSKLTPEGRAVIEKMQENILKEWGDEAFGLL